MKKTQVVTVIAFASTLALMPLAANSQSCGPDQQRDRLLETTGSVEKSAWRNNLKVASGSFSVKEPLTLAIAQLAEGSDRDAAGGGIRIADSDDDDKSDDDKSDSDDDRGSDANKSSRGEEDDSDAGKCGLSSDNTDDSKPANTNDSADSSLESSSKTNDADPSKSNLNASGKSSNSPTEASSEPSDSSAKPTDVSSEPTDASSNPTDASSKPSDSSSTASDSLSKPAGAGSKPSDSSSRAGDSTPSQKDTGSQSTEISQEPDDSRVLQDSTTDPKWKLSIEKGQEQLNSGNLNGAVSYFQRALKAAQRMDNNDRILELNYRKLGQAYYQKEDFAKAFDSLSSGLALCEKLGIRDSLLEDALTKVSPNYKAIEMSIFPDDIVKQMRNAGVQKITAAKQDAGHLITFDLADKYTKAIGNDDVSDMGFAKKVSFQFLEKDGESWQISGMKGLTAKAKGMWVNLMQTMLSGGGGAPKAEVTAGKMGIQKTVNVDLPNDIYGTARGILMNLSKAIQSPPVFARTGLPRSN